MHMPSPATPAKATLSLWNTPATQQERFAAELKNEGVLPLLVQLLHQHSTEDGMLALINSNAATLESGHQYPQPTSETFQSTLALRQNSAKALRNIVTHTSSNRKEVELLCLPEDLRSFVEIFFLRWSDSPVEAVDHPCSQLAQLLTFACDANFRKSIELYGGVYVISDYSLNVLTYMTAQTETVKSVLVSMRPFIGMLVETMQQQAPQAASQLQEHNNNILQLLQSVANVLHNLSWKSDFNSKQIMRDFKAMAIEIKDLKTLKSLLEPLLNLTAHCTINKIDFCKVEGMLDFLIFKLGSTTNTSLSSSASSSSSSSSFSASQFSQTELAIVVNSGGIFRNISSYLVTREDLIEMLRSQNIVDILLEQLKAASFAVVSNACIPLSYLAARSPKDVFRIKELGGIQILHRLTNSKHEPIKLGASKTLQHLFTFHLNNYNGFFKVFRIEIHSFLSENFDTLQCDASPNGSPSHCSLHNRNPNLKKFNLKPNRHLPVSHKVTRLRCHDSIGSTQSEPVNKSSMHYHHPNHHHRRSMHQSSATADNHKSAAAAALLNLTSKNNPNSAAYDQQQMIHSYSGQTLNSCFYATLPASARISATAAKDYDGDFSAMVESAMMGSAGGGGDAASDYDISLCDISGNSLACLAPLPPQ
ncbi:anaphase-promoting complex subunit 2 [Tyrophagus putrescentiae]|nr:anaphase-promoting complex subunit 2 [Tyrophagus putrescentiae]KAH9391759.1 anaphase-promoting complex subunit 2 [Tyrophagus putrescentiae]